MSEFSRVKVLEFSAENLNIGSLTKSANANRKKSTTAVINKTIGFIGVYESISNDKEMIISVDGILTGLIAIEERKAKQSEIRKEVSSRLETLLKTDSTFKVTKKIRSEITKDVKKELAKIAQPDQTDVFVAFDLENKRLILGSSNDKVCSEVIAFLSFSCSMNILPIEFNMYMSEKLTAILSKPEHNLTELFDLGYNVSLENLSGTPIATARYSYQNLVGLEIQKNLDEGKMVNAIELVYKVYAKFRVTKKNAITNIEIVDSALFDDHVGKVDLPGDESLASILFYSLSKALRLLKVMIPDIIETLDKGDDRNTYVVCDDSPKNEEDLQV